MRLLIFAIFFLLAAVPSSTQGRSFTVGVDESKPTAPAPKTIDIGGVESAGLPALPPPPEMPEYAAFRRGRYLWVVTRRNMEFDIGSPYEFTWLKNKVAGVVRIAAPENLAPIFKEAGGRVLLELLPKNPRPRPPRFLSDEETGSLSLELEGEISAVVSFFDPEIGDELFVLVPRINAKDAAIPHLHYPFFERLTSLRGLALAAKTDDMKLKVDASSKRVEVRSPSLNAREFQPKP